MTKETKIRYLKILITFVTASHTHRAQYIFLRLEYFFTRSRRNGARKRAIASADSRSRKPRRLNFHSIQWNARMTSLPSILSPRARHDRGAVPRRGANAGVQPCDAVFSASWKIFKYRNLSKTYLRSTYCTNKYFRTLKVLSYENTFESMTKVRAADLLEFFDPETRQFEPPKHGLNGRQ